MSDLGYFIWLIAMAIAIVAVLTIGTLAAAGLLGRDKESRPEPEPHHEARPAPGATSGDRRDAA